MVAQAQDPWQYPTLFNSRPFQHWWWSFQQRAYPLSDIPVDAKTHALQQIQQFKATQAAAAPAGVVPGDSWTNIGPAPIAGFFTASAGRVTAIAVDPANDNHWIIAAAQGGVWQTTDAGATWSALTDGQPSLAGGAIAFAPSNPNIIYAGTGEPNFSGDSYAGSGLLKSVDGGTNWTRLAADKFAKAGFSSIKVNPSDANILVAATGRGVAGFRFVFPPSIPPRGLFKSADGGLTWAQTLTGEGTALEVVPGNFNNQYGALGDPFLATANGVYRSTDGGSTWSSIAGPWTGVAGGVGRIAVAIAPSDVNTVYVSVQDAFGGGGNDGQLLGVWRTSNAWDTTPTWIQLPNPTSAGNQLWYDHVLSVNPSNSSIVYLGTTPLFRFNGSVWSDVSDGIHVDQHALAWAGNRLIAGNDGGVWSTTDGGSSWNNHNTTLSITQFYAGSVHPTDPNFALGGSQDNGTEKWTGTSTWQNVFGGDGSYNAISATSPNTNWAVSFQNLAILRTTNGVNFVAADSGIDRVGAPFIGRFEKCPGNDDVFIAGTDNLWKSTNFFSGGMASWSSNGPEIGSSVVAMAFAPLGGCTIYAFGTINGQLRLTINGGGSWTDIKGANLPFRAVSGMAFDPTNADVLYLVYSGFDEATPSQPGHVFKTSNATAVSPTWVDVTPPVNIPHNAIVIDPANPNVVYVGTDIGVWKSADGGSSWAHMGPEVGMPNVAVFDLRLNDATGRLLAFTHGRGAFQLTPGGGGNLTLSLDPSASSFHTSDTLVTSVTVTNPGLEQTVDFYFGAVLPDGNTVIFFTDLAFASGIGTLSHPSTLQPIAAGVSLSAPFTFSQSPFFSYQWTGSEPAGAYTLFVAAVKPGALADDHLDPGDLIALSTAVVTFSP